MLAATYLQSCLILSDIEKRELNPARDPELQVRFFLQ